MLCSILGETGELDFFVLLDYNPARMRRRRVWNKESKDQSPLLVTDCGQVTFPFLLASSFCNRRVLGWTVYLVLLMSTGSRVIWALLHNSVVGK